MDVPIVCENPDCSHYEQEINRVTGLDEADLDAFYEDFDGTDPADLCPVCHQPGVALDPEDPVPVC